MLKIFWQYKSLNSNYSCTLTYLPEIFVKFPCWKECRYFLTKEADYLFPWRKLGYMFPWQFPCRKNIKKFPWLSFGFPCNGNPLFLLVISINRKRCQFQPSLQSIWKRLTAHVCANLPMFLLRGGSRILMCIDSLIFLLKGAPLVLLVLFFTGQM